MDNRQRTGILESIHYPEANVNILGMFIIETRRGRRPEYSTKSMLSILFHVCFEALTISTRTPLALHPFNPLSLPNVRPPSPTDQIFDVSYSVVGEENVGDNNERTDWSGESID
jgi:hypothetical protein